MKFQTSFINLSFDFVLRDIFKEQQINLFKISEIQCHWLKIKFKTGGTKRDSSPEEKFIS